LDIATTAGASDVDTQLTGLAGAAPLTTGANPVVTGSYFVSESGGLTNYDAALSCFNDNGAGGGTAGNGIKDGGEAVVSVGANQSVSVGSGDVVVCTFTNTRKQGSIELTKSWSGTAGQTTLNIGTNAGGSQVDTQLTGAAGAAPLTTGADTVDTGTYFVTEVGGLSTYDNSLACVNNKTNPATPVTVGANQSVPVAQGDVVVCTFTNTRQQGTIELKKSWSGTAGQTTLNIGTNAGGSQVDTQLTGAAGAAPLTTGANTIDTGTYFVAETGGLANYDASLSCVNNKDPNNPTAVTVGANQSVPVAQGDVVLCVFTNTRKQ